MTGTDREIRVERRIAARPSAVYAYLTDSVQWARWQGSRAEIEAVPGGRFRMVLADETTAEGAFVSLEPDRRVVFTWGWVGHPTVPPGSSTVEIELSPDGEGTLVRLVHRGLPPEERALHVAGWDHYLPRLADAAEGNDPGPDLPPA
jgi:uncharacterized protein YndB with AHSA1/START domain